jgi:hypothetical protein
MKIWPGLNFKCGLGIEQLFPKFGELDLTITCYVPAGVQRRGQTEENQNVGF